MVVGILPQMAMLRESASSDSNTIMTFKRGKLGVKIVKAFISHGFLVPNLVHQGWAVHRERDLHFFTEEQFERLGVGGRGGVRVNWRGGVLWGLLEG